MLNFLKSKITRVPAKYHKSIHVLSHFILLIGCLSCTASLAQEIDKTQLKLHYESATKQFNTYEQKHRRTTKTKNVNLSYLQWGDNQNKTKVLIWLHGSLSNAYEFAPFALDLVKIGYRIISIDQYNAGKTPLPPFDASFDDLCIDIKSLMDTLQIQHAVIGGFSRGGYLATNFYKLFPTYVAGLILEDGGSVAFNTSYFKLNKRQLEQKLQEVNLPADIEEKYFGFYNDQFAAYKSLYDDSNKSDQFEILSFLKPLDQKWITYRGQQEYYHMRDSLQMSEAIFGNPNVSKYASSIIKIAPFEIFKQVDIPVLILDAISVHDPMPVYAENKILAEKHSNFIKHIAFENVDHNIHFAYPEQFLKVITKFLNEVKLTTD